MGNKLNPLTCTLDVINYKTRRYAILPKMNAKTKKKSLIPTCIAHNGEY